ncbi:MAG: ribonuclease HII, partial [Acidobacteria bacterium]|nr:ribonuclease HII [Acidobacteriota bacterium]
MIAADWSLERQARRRGFRRIAGLDEAGRGCLAGPVVAAAVVLGDRFPAERLLDSKQLRPAQRRRWYEEIRRCGGAIAVGQADPEEIDRINILEATRLAMRRAVLG